MQEIMAPFLKAVEKEFQQRWPHMDAELATIRILCQQRSIEPPSACMSTSPIHVVKPPSYKPSAGRPHPRGPSKEDGMESKQRTSGSARCESNLSYYKTSRPNSQANHARPESTVSTVFRDTPLEEMGNTGTDGSPVPPIADDEEASDQKNRCTDLALPQKHIDDDENTPYILRRSACLRERLDARREESVAALGKTSLMSLGRVQSLLEKDRSSHEEDTAGVSSNLSGFAERVANVRQGLRGEFISQVPLLSLEVVTQEEQFWLTGKLVPVHYARGETLFNEGDTGDKLYIVESGTCIVKKMIEGEKATLCDIKPGDSFGDMAVMYDMPRAASVIAATAVKLLSLSRDDILGTVCSESLENMRKMTRIQLMQATPVLAKLDQTHRVQLLKHVSTENFWAGKEIMRIGWRSGDGNRRVYIIEEGTCSQTSDNRNEVLSPGTNFGNLELAFGCPQQTTVVATTDMSVFSIAYSKIQELLGDQADIAMQLMKRAMNMKLLREAHVKFLHQPDHILDSVLDQGKFHRFKTWQPIITKGDDVTHFMMLDEGISIQHDEDISNMMENTVERANSTEHSRPGDTFGMDCVIDERGAKSPYTLVAISECSVFYLPVEVLDTLPAPTRGSILDIPFVAKKSCASSYASNPIH